MDKKVLTGIVLGVSGVALVVPKVAALLTQKEDKIIWTRTENVESRTNVVEEKPTPEGLTEEGLTQLDSTYPAPAEWAENDFPKTPVEGESHEEGTYMDKKILMSIVLGVAGAALVAPKVAALLTQKEDKDVWTKMDKMESVDSDKDEAEEGLTQLDSTYRAEWQANGFPQTHAERERLKKETDDQYKGKDI